MVPGDLRDVCGVGREQVRRYCLPFVDPMQVTPPRDVIEKIHSYTGGDIRPADWYPARLSEPLAGGAEART